MSDCCCSCCQPSGPQPPGGGGPEPQPRCTRYQVTFESISVSAIDDGFLGGNLEAHFTFVVNGQARTWVNNDLGTGVSNIGITMFVDVPADTSTITIEVSGVEDDPVFDDDLAGFNQVWGQAQNWGLGSQAGSASDSNITYSLNYQITCAQKTTVAVSRAAIMAYAQERVKKRKKAKAVSQATLFSWSLDRFRRSGWDVQQLTDEHVVLAGYGSFPMLAERKYAGPKKGD
jgi:hypothetical protein